VLRAAQTAPARVVAHLLRSAKKIIIHNMSSEEAKKMRAEVTKIAAEKAEIFFGVSGINFIINEKEEIGRYRGSSVILFKSETLKLKKDDVIFDPRSGQKFRFVSGHPKWTADAFEHYHANVEVIEDEEESPQKPSLQG